METSLSSPKNNDLGFYAFLVKLSCGHRVVTDVMLKMQYGNDQHFIFCPTCRINPDLHNNFSWHEVVSYRGYHRERLFKLYGRIPQIVPSDIMRLQPKVPRTRVRPFPYVKRVRT